MDREILRKIIAEKLKKIQNKDLMENSDKELNNDNNNMTQEIKENSNNVLHDDKNSPNNLLQSRESSKNNSYNFLLQSTETVTQNTKKISPKDKNSTEVSGENVTNVTNVTEKFGNERVDKLKTVTNVTNVTFSPDNSVENLSKGRDKFETVTTSNGESSIGSNDKNKESDTKPSSNLETKGDKKLKTVTEFVPIGEDKFETVTTSNGEDSVINRLFSQEESGENIEVGDGKIVIKYSTRTNQTKFEIEYKYVGTIEDSTRIRDLKIPQLPRYELITKKKGETLVISVVVDFYIVDGKAVYYIRDKKNIVEKLYKFKGDRRISKKLINDALDIWLEKIRPAEKVRWVDVKEVVEKYGEWDEINKDPIGFFLSRATEVVGNDKLKIAVLISVVSSQLKKMYGIYRAHLVLTGSSGTGKSSTIKSILKMFYEMSDGVDDWVVLSITRLTKESLGYLDVGTLDGKVLFIEQLDNIEGVNYLREAMSEGRISTLVPVKTETGEIKTVQKIIPGQPTFITTNVTANVDHQITNRSIQLYLSPIEDEKIKETIINTILLRRGIEEAELYRLKLVTYVWLKTRPNDPLITSELSRKVTEILKKFINFKNIYRATEITRNLIRATASMFGHEQVTEEDVNFVMRYFKKDIILTTLELSERDLQLLRWLRDHGFVYHGNEEEVKDVSTSEIAQIIKMSTQETKKLLDALYDKGLLWKAYDGKKFSWALLHYGLKVLSELEEEMKEVQEVKADADFDVDGMLVNYVRSKLLDKDVITDEELSSILVNTVQATDLKSQEMWKELLKKLGVIEDLGDGRWKVKNT